jgi:DNA polymerase elongation subunit (family B)
VELGFWDVDNPVTAPKILIVDIETSPHLVYSWGLWKQDINPEQLVKASEILCWGATWYGKRGYYYDNLFQKSMIKNIRDGLDEADIVVHYNGKKFDVPIINTAILKAGLKPPSPYKQVDLLGVVKSKFKFPYSRLGFVCPDLGLSEKEHHEGFSLWKKCMEGDKKAWATMKKYNLKDVEITEALYTKLKPWIDNHPRLYDDPRTCPYCNSSKVYRKQSKIALKHRYIQFHCQSCGKHYSGPKEKTDGKGA